MVTLDLVRNAAGYTIEEASEHCEVSVEEMKRLENDSGEMTKAIACKIKKLYGVSLDNLQFAIYAFLLLNASHGFMN